jgi:glycosyltransferase involved in cell wall biosynthesis
MKISVIVPVRNEEDSIGALLDSLLGQTLPPAEIVITDGGSTDATTAIIQKYIEGGAPLKLIRTTRALPGRARNLSAGRAQNEWLAFTDAGIKPGRQWLELLAARAAADPSVDVVYGAYEPVTDTLFKECAAISYLSPPVEIEGALMRPRSIASALMRRTAWETVGGFPEHLRSAEDLLFMNRLEAAEFRLAYAPDAVVYWDLQPNFWRTFKRFQVYARNNIRAGLWQQWQKPVLTRYLWLLLLALPVLFLGRRWLLVPASLWLLFLLARALVAMWRHRIAMPAGRLRNAQRLVILMPLIAVLDLGLFIGSLLWLLTDKFRLGGQKLNVGHGT